MFEQYAETSKAVLVEAQDLAVELGSGYIGVGHLLDGCAEVRADTAGLPLAGLRDHRGIRPAAAPAHTRAAPRGRSSTPRHSAPSGSTTTASGRPLRQPSDPAH